MATLCRFPLALASMVIVPDQVAICDLRATFCYLRESHDAEIPGISGRCAAMDHHPGMAPDTFLGLLLISV